MTKHEKRWVNLLEKLGYDWGFGKLEYWYNVLYAIPEGKEKFPIAYTDAKNGTGYIVNQNDIKVSIQNLRILEKYYSLKYPDDYYVFNIIDNLTIR